jgi:hypothetical protein
MALREDVGVVEVSGEVDARRLGGVVCAEVERQREEAALPQCALLARNG